MKYKIIWLQGHNIENWKSEENLIKFYEDMGIKTNIVNYDSDWVDVEHFKFFEANSMREAKEIVNTFDIPDEVYSVYNNKNEQVFTDEDI